MSRRRYRQTRWLLAIAAVVACAVSACGVPTSGKPVADRVIGGTTAAGGVGLVQPPDAPGALVDPTPSDFVSKYLDSTAGGTNTDGEVAAAKAFMTSDQASRWNPGAGAGVTVVRQIGDLADKYTPLKSSAVDRVTGTFQIVGQFSVATGMLQPTTSGKPRITLSFDVGTDEHDALRLLSAPPMMLMSEQALQKYFIPHPVYFWDTSDKALVPDLRYVSSLQSPIVQATNIVTWALNPPVADWIAAATGGASGVTVSLVDPTIKVDKSGAYVVNLSPNAHALSTQAQLQLAYQLRWSLGQLVADPTRNTVPSPVRIEIDGQPQIVSADDNYMAKVPNLAMPRSATEAASYGILNGKVLLVAVDTSAKVTTQVPGQPRVLDSAKNAGVSLAAVNGAASAAALVRSDSRGKDSLWIRRLGTSSSDFVEVKGLPSGNMTRPQFVTQPLDDVVVTVNGQPYLINRSNQVHAIELPSSIGKITAFSVAADGHRIAFVSNGGLYMSVLTTTDSNSPAMTAQKPIQLGFLTNDATITRATAVAWSSVDQLIVAGTDGQQSTVAEIDVSGSVEPNSAQEYGTLSISQVAAYSYDPFVDNYFDNVMLQTSGGAYAGRSARLPLVIGPPTHTTPLSSPFFQD